MTSSYDCMSVNIKMAAIRVRGALFTLWILMFGITAAVLFLSFHVRGTEESLPDTSYIQSQ